MTWWHQVCKNNYQGLPATSWMDIKVLMRATFVPSYHRRELLLKLQRLQQRHMCVNEYFTELESLMLRVGLEECNELKITRFISGVRRDIQDLIELYEYSTLEDDLTLKIETQLKKKMEQGGVTHGREKIKRNMINPLPSLTKNHHLEISHQMVTLTIPPLKYQVP